MKTGIVIQARMGSSRLPGKVLMQVTPDTTVLDWVIARIKLNQVCGEIILATTTDARDDVLEEYAFRRGISCFRGSESDVLARYVGTAERFALDAVVRITSDCPLIEPCLIEQVINTGRQRGLEYVTTDGYPRGSGDVEFVMTDVLMQINQLAKDKTYYREHVTTFVAEHPEQFELEILQAQENMLRPDLRLCIDEIKDLEVVRHVAEHFRPRVDFALAELILFLDKRPELARHNRDVKQKTR